jgi:hypothetical protein
MECFQNIIPCRFLACLNRTVCCVNLVIIDLITLTILSSVQNDYKSEITPDLNLKCLELLLWICSGECQVCGLGTLSPKSHVFPNTLHCATVPIVQRKVCEQTLRPYITLQPGSLCAGGGKADACVVS